MATAFRRQMLVQPDGRIDFCDDRLPTGAQVEVIIILDEDKKTSAEELAIQRLQKPEKPEQWITVMEQGQEIDEAELKQWIIHGQCEECLPHPNAT